MFFLLPGLAVDCAALWTNPLVYAYIACAYTLLACAYIYNIACLCLYFVFVLGAWVYNKL